MTQDTEERPLNDAGILDLIAAFEVWQKGKPSESDGLNMMLAFVADHIRRGVPVAQGVMGRFWNEMPELQERAATFHPDVGFALEYLLAVLRDDPAKLDSDPLIDPAIVALRSVKRLAPKSTERSAFMGLLNVTFGMQVAERTSAQWSAAVESDFSNDVIEVLETPAARMICSAGLNLSLYANSMQIGRNAWDEGLDIVMKIQGHMISPASVGQLCSLTPPGVPARVDWRSQTWMTTPDYKNWLETSYQDEAPLRPEMRQQMEQRLRGLM